VIYDYGYASLEHLLLSRATDPESIKVVKIFLDVRSEAAYMSVPASLTNLHFDLAECINYMA
jgi:hypothetical protein